jgi:hypothetical protein
MDIFNPIRYKLLCEVGNDFPTTPVEEVTNNPNSSFKSWSYTFGKYKENLTNVKAIFLGVWKGVPHLMTDPKSLTDNNPFNSPT